MLTWQQSEDGGMVDVQLANPTPYEVASSPTVFCQQILA